MYDRTEKGVPTEMSIEPEEIAEARELLKEFEKSPGLSKKSCFLEAIEILNDFLTEHPYSEFSERANKLKKIYIEILIKRLGGTSFSNFDDWVKTFLVVLESLSEIKTVLENNSALEKNWRKFLEQYGYDLGKRLAEALKSIQPE
jgi:hypothetical protein